MELVWRITGTSRTLTIRLQLEEHPIPNLKGSFRLALISQCLHTVLCLMEIGLKNSKGLLTLCEKLVDYFHLGVSRDIRDMN